MTPLQEHHRVVHHINSLHCILPPCPLCACGISGHKEHTAGQLCPLFLGGASPPPLYFSLSTTLSYCTLHISSVFLPGSGTDRSGFSPPSLKKKLSTCDAEQAKKKHRNMACLQQRWFREEECSILYAGRISLIEVSA